MNNKEKYINPFTDFGFEKLFGTEFNKELLIDFLNQVLDDREHIQQLTYLNTEHQGKTSSDRKAIFDLHCENEKGDIFIIELQNVRQQYFKDRSIFYSTFPIQRQAQKGQDWDYYLKAVYMIGILNFSFPDIGTGKRYVREVKLIDRHTHEVFYEKLTFIYLEIPKFQKAEDELSTHFDKWMYVLKNLNQLRDRPKKLQERVFEKLFEEAEIAKLKPDDMKTYEESLKTYRDNYSVLKTAKEEGIKEGFSAGASKREIEIAKNLKTYNIPIEKIVATTGLTKEEIERL